MILRAILEVLRSLEEEQELIIDADKITSDEMEITNGDGGEHIPDSLKRRLSDRIGDVVTEEVCKIGKKGLVLAILDSGGVGLR